MSEVSMRFELDRGPWEGEEYERCFAVGGSIGGRLIVDVLNGQRARELRVELRWRTEGRGDRNEEKVAAQTVLSGDLPAMQSAAMPFTLDVPDAGPITYEGHLIRIRWFVRGVVDVPWGKDIFDEVPVTVLPTYEA